MLGLDQCCLDHIPSLRIAELEAKLELLPHIVLQIINVELHFLKYSGAPSHIIRVILFEPLFASL